MLYKLNSLLTKSDKTYLIILLFLSIIISIIETIGVSAIMPFISVATDFNAIQTNKFYLYIYNIFEFDSEINFVIAFGILLIIFYIFRSFANLFYLYILSDFTQSRYHLLAYRLFENYLGLPYKEFINRNSSTMSKTLHTEAINLTTIISSLLFIMSEFFIALFIYSVLIYVNYKITILLTFILFINGLFMTKTISSKIKKAGIKRAEVQKRFYEIINKSFSNFKIIKLQSHDYLLLDDFKVASADFAKANIQNNTLAQIPRLFLEAFGFSMIIFIILFLLWKYQQDVSHNISLISIFILALYRLMPSVNRILTNYNQILFCQKALDIIHSDLHYHHQQEGNELINFTDKVIIQNLTFGYDPNKPILQNINLIIKKGSKIAITGESGSGKSTLVDIIIGLYKPYYGSVTIDNTVLDDTNVKSWRGKIGYIPQSIYLFDGTVGENIAFGSNYDIEKIDECLKKAKLFDFLQTQSGRDTLVGEAGIKLSGGQKQRIAIARALYINPEILVLDEGTSALDNETEALIMDEIYNLCFDKTLIIIAHRLSTLKKCEKIYKLDNGSLYEV
ncbi:MAG: ABC transporter ATP-binding protein [Sulfuricurvum sp.]|nr:ABC transporter ATP-binding protein [Sulfuricurvum sp.]MDP3023092.1 ABC transporter ATP-binding protein [Sulfuricurvum sp.]